MTALHSLTMALWQSTDTPPPSTERHLLLIFIGFVALALLIQAITTSVAAFAMMKTLKEVKELTHDFHAKASPILVKTGAMVDDLAPKIRTVSENVTQMSYTVREKLDEVGETVSQLNRTLGEANSKTRAQVDHVDRMVSSALNTTEEITQAVVHGIKVPVKQAAGMIAGFRTGFEKLAKNFSGRGGSGGDIGL